MRFRTITEHVSMARVVETYREAPTALLAARAAAKAINRHASNGRPDGTNNVDFSRPGQPYSLFRFDIPGSNVSASVKVFEGER